ncbi:MBL fold metallo-hydrolase [Gracilimonas mengyeensis]|uniref:Glyoxylase, beta-lactamase superfamily II n=1 Tax=Gracilimonas mengyeensis TaxID=1302730 RepID=A0A521BW23_9BACT|nr:MBL fold metallo-hydrolase [Gracilimonas mengyeensis]SMO51392.1 Glyoxylase, beta-lactamase superfamily II [Gracilimonas mengyeensis]
MNRREFLLKSTLLGAAATLPVSKLLAFNQDDPFTTLRRNVGTFTGSGGTIGWLVNDEGIVVIDSQFPDSAKTCVTGLEEQSAAPFDILINTHHHGDHTGGNSVLKDKVEHIVAHDNVPSLQRITAESRGQEVVDAQVYADTTYHKSWKTQIGDETVHLKHYGPAHTGGDSVVYFEQANVIHMGDLIFNRVHPFIDYGGGASIANWITTLESVTEEYPADAIYIFGHGNPNFGVTGSKDDLLVMRNFLSALLDYTREGIEAGKSVDELANIETLDGFEDFKAPDWRLPLSANIKVAYAELTKNK